MTLPWAPDHPTTPEIAATAIGAQFPALAHLLPELRLLGSGWDNDVWALPEEAGQPERIAFRFPRRALAVELLEVEARALPTLAPRLPIPIPLPAWIGAPSAAWPLPFYGYRLLPGTTADRAHLSPDERRSALPALLSFLAALHATPPAIAAEAKIPLDTFRSDPGQRISRTLARQDLLPPTLDPALRQAALHALTSSPPPLPADPTRWRCCHGDLYARHVLWNGGQISGIIDWGDLCVADPAIDLALLRGFCQIPAPELAEILRAHHYPAPPDELPALLHRATLHAIVYGLRLLSYAAGIDDHDLAEEATGALHHLISP